MKMKNVCRVIVLSDLLCGGQLSQAITIKRISIFLYMDCLNKIEMITHKTR